MKSQKEIRLSVEKIGSIFNIKICDNNVQRLAEDFGIIKKEVKRRETFTSKLRKINEENK